MQKFKNFIIGFISFIGCLIFALLTYLSYTTTLVNIGYDDEIPSLIQDNIFLNILIILLITTLLYFLNKLLNKVIKHLNVNILLILSCIVISGISIIWILSSNTYPDADQYTCALYADEFNMGNFEGLLMGQYLGMHHHQLGLVSVLRIVFALFGTYNYRAFQIINAISLSLLVISGFMIIKNMHFDIDKKKTQIYYLILMLLCIPLYIYTDFVYGEILTISFMFLTMWMLLAYLNKHKWYNLLLCLVSGFICCLVRRNTIIFIIACSLILIVKLIIERNKHVLWALIITILAGVSSIYVPDLIYKDHIPSNSKSMPSTLHIAMGLHGEAGWYDSYNYETYKYLDYDPIEANKWAKDNINESLSRLKQNNEVLSFFTNKINTQWNVPMYQCLVMNHRFNGTPGGLATSIYVGKLNDLFNLIANYYHLFIITTCLIFVIYSFKNRKDLHLEDYILLVFIIGGFLFSIMWEAKARYILPYFIAMIPYSAITIGLLFKRD